MRLCKPVRATHEAMKDAASAILECKSWKSKLDDAGASETQGLFLVRGVA